MSLKFAIASFACAALLQLMPWETVSAQQLDMSYPGLTGESAPLWIARESGIFKEYGIDARLVYMIEAINRGWSDQSTASLFRLQEEAAGIEARKS